MRQLTAGLFMSPVKAETAPTRETRMESFIFTVILLRIEKKIRVRKVHVINDTENTADAPRPNKAGGFKNGHRTKFGRVY